MSKKIKLVILVALIILLGFLRDYLFFNINWIYLTLTEDRPNQALEEFYFLLEWSPRNINILKWFLTFLFTGLFWLLSVWIVDQIFKNKKFNRITSFAFIGLMGISGLLYTIGLIIGLSDSLYGVIRTLMGFAQSFMPLMILYVTFKFLPVQNESNS